MKDSDIIALFNERSETALTAVDEHCGAYCRAVAFNILHSREDSEECFQDTLMKLWETIPPACPDDLGSYSARVTRNLALDALRRKKAVKRGGDLAGVPLDEIAGILPDGGTSGLSAVETAADSQRAAGVINSFLGSLPKRKMRLFVQRYWYFRSVSDLADEFFMTENNVRQTLRRLREKLREQLEREGIDI